MSEIVNLLETLDYKNESISSKTLIEKGGGSLTLYAFDKAQGLGEHTSPYLTVVQLIEGKAEIRIDGQNSLMSEGEFVTIFVDIPYSFQAIQKVKALIYRVNSSLQKIA